MTRLSVVIPTYERPRNLARCLEALADARRPRADLEVIVVDDGGGVPLDRVIERVTDRLDVTLLRQDNAGPARARNAGVAKASGDIVLLTDDDCRPTAEWLTAMERAAAEHPGAMLVGRTVNALEDDPFATASETIVAHLTRWSSTHDDVVPFAASNNLAVPTTGFLDLGGFDESFPLAAGEDRDLVARWAVRYPMASVPDAVVEHAHEHTLLSFVKQHHGYGRGARVYARRQEEHGGDPTLYKGFGFYAALVRAALDEGLLILALVLLAQVAGATGFLRETIDERRTS